MLPFFPTPYPDELFYSVCARYHIWSRNLYIKDTVRDLFGSKTATSIIDFPVNLGNLYKRLSQNSLLTPDRIIKENTLLPFYRPFLSEERVDKMESVMKGEVENSNKNYKGEISSYKIKPPSKLRLCPRCLVEDQDKYGEPYWHRVHQLSGVEICHIHHAWLVESDIRMTSRLNEQVFHALYNKEGNENALSTKKEEYKTFYLKISEYANWLLLNNVPVLGFDELIKRYKFYLSKKELITVQGLVRQSKLTDALLDFYEHEFLELIIGPNYGKIRLMKSILTRKNKSSSVHPVYHILLMIFLEISAEKFFFDEIEEILPFGEGPWLCFNGASKHYLKPVVNVIDIHRDNNTGKPVGTFSCTCGFVYSRVGPDLKNEDKYRVGRIIQFGPLWEKELVRLTQEGKNKSKIAKALNVSFTAVDSNLKKVAKNIEKTEVGSEDDFDKKRDEYRKEWLEALKNHPGKSKWQIAKSHATRACIWLYRNDLKWFNEYSPKTNNKNTGGKAHVNWEQRDQEFAEEILKAAEEIKMIEGRPIRLTKKRIVRHIGKKHYIFQWYLEKLPKSKVTLDSVIESTDEYHIRCFKWSIQVIQEKGEDVKLWRIKRETSIEKFSDAVSRVIEEEEMKSSIL
jgi:hypothetical protein